MSSFLKKPIKPINKNIDNLKNITIETTDEDTYLKLIRDRLTKINSVYG